MTNKNFRNLNFLKLQKFAHDSESTYNSLYIKSCDLDIWKMKLSIIIHVEVVFRKWNAFLHTIIVDITKERQNFVSIHFKQHTSTGCVVRFS